MNTKIYNGLLIGIFIFSFLIRVVGLEKSPPSLGFDEASLGYNAYSLLKTGKDEYGNFLPLSLRSFNDFKPALYSYLSIPFIYIFGLNATAVRMVSAISGVVSVAVLYFLIKKFVENKWIGLLFLFVLSNEPWRLHFSRNAFETNLSAAFFGIAALLLLAGKTRWKRLISTIFFGLAAYSYHSARLSAPLLLLLWIFDPILLLKEKVQVDYKKIILLVGLVTICLPIFIANNSQSVLTRFRQENVFARYYPYAPKEIQNPFSMGYYFLGIISGHVFSYLSPINLNYRIYEWVKGSPQFIPGMGMLGWIEGLLLIIGAIFVIRNIFKSFKYRFLVYWLVAGIAPAAVTWNWFHPLRSLNIFLAMEIVVVIGGLSVIGWIKRNWENKIGRLILFVGLIVMMMFNVLFVINNELKYSAFENHGEYQPGGYKEGMPYFATLLDQYSQVLIDTPHAQGFVFFLFYTKFDPHVIQQYASIRPSPEVGGNVSFNFDKYIFRSVDWPKDKELENTLFWTRPDITDAEVNAVRGAKVERRIKNALYETASIITTE